MRDVGNCSDPEFEGVKVAGDPDSRDELASDQTHDEPVAGAPASSEMAAPRQHSAEDRGSRGRGSAQDVAREDVARRGCGSRRMWLPLADAAVIEPDEELRPRRRRVGSGGRARGPPRAEKPKKRTSSSGTSSRCR